MESASMAPRVRVVFLTHYFPPEKGAAQTRIAALAAGLQASGVHAVVHTGFPHYPDGAVKAPYRNRAWQREPGPVPVVRSIVCPVANRGFARRLLDHTAFAAGAVATASLAGPADVVVVESPPLFTAAAGVLYARLKRAALVMNVADRWPASAVELGALSDERAIAAAEWLERWCYRHCDAVTTPTRGIAAALETLPEARGKVVRIDPAVDLDRFDPAPPPAAGPLRVLYAGTVGLAQGVDTLVDAAELAGPDVVEVTIAGGGADAELIAARAARLANVRWLGELAADAVPRLYAEMDAGAVLLRAAPILESAFPTKLLEVMAAGRRRAEERYGRARSVEGWRELLAGLTAAAGARRS
jgi:glycosyltransferase involved in cell wall biosynthesis